MILEQTELYSTMQSINTSNPQKLDITIDDIMKVFGIILYMGILKLPNRRMYWQPRTRVDVLANAMSVNRFGKILQVLHYNDNNLIPNHNSAVYNKCYKIQPLVDYLRGKFFTAVIPETFVSVDEQMVPFKGVSGLKRYLPKKNKKWGYKLWALAGVSGYVYNFEVDGEKGKSGPPDGSDAPERCGESGFVVLRLTEMLEKNTHKLFFDNYFTSPELVQHLSSKGIWALGTLRANRSRNCPLPSEKDLKKGGRGCSTENISKDQSVVVTSWYDNKRVVLISNFIGKQPVGECSRYDRKAKERKTFERPGAVRMYNTYMGGVDKADMMLALYRTKYRSRKWYQRIAFHLISQCAVNAWIIYKEIGGTDSYLKFLSDICITLLASSRQGGESDIEQFPNKKRVKASDVT